MREIAPRITVDANVRFGNAVIEGTRVPVHVVIGALAAEMPMDKICEEHDIVREDVLASLSYAASVLAEPRRIS